MNKLIELARNERASKMAPADAIFAAAEAESRDLTADEFDKVKAAADSAVEIDARIAELTEIAERNAVAAKVLPAVGGAIVRSEPLTYTADAAREGRSFFADAFRAQFGSDGAAADRLNRHRRESEVEKRDITSSTLNGLIPPVYLLDQAAALARAGRPFADAVPGYQLPAEGMTVYVTRVTTGTASAVQSTQNTAATETDMVTTDVTIPVVTILGQQDISRQALERGAITDQLVFNDLANAYATALDANSISGSGSNGQHRGILNVTGTGVQTWTGTTVASFMSKLNGLLSDVAGGRFAPATAIVMHPRRWHWLLSQADSSGRPLVEPYGSLASSPQGLGATGYGVVGSIAGLPVIADANVPTNLGAATNEDRVIATRLSDLAIWESGTQVFRFEQAVNPPATVRLAIAGYSAFTAERYPAGSAVMVGSGLVAPTF